MISWRTIFDALNGKPAHPEIKNVKQVDEDTLYFDSLTRGMVVAGDPGTGKTTLVAQMIIDYTLTYPDRPVFIFDASGSLINEMISICYLLPRAQREAVERRLILDIPGDENWVIPKPLFSKEYGLLDEDLVEKAVGILLELNHEKIKLTPIMATAITVTAPHLFRLLMAILNEHGQCWQVTEAKKLLFGAYAGGALKTAVALYGQYEPAAADYFRQTLLQKKLPPTTRTAKVDALTDALQVIEPKPLRARYGYDRPGITPREIIDRGLVYMVSGERLTNQETAQAWVFWDEFASLRAVINQRVPHDPAEKPVLLVIDEVYKLFEIKGMAKALGQITTYFRSRQLMPMIVIQAYWQLDDLLKEQIWNMGNLVTFALSNFYDAKVFAEQVFEYDPVQEKLPAASEGGQPILEYSSGQFHKEANWIQRLKWRQVVMRRYLNERDREDFVAFVEQTREVPKGELPRPLIELKEGLFRRRAIPLRDALNVVNNRRLIHREMYRSRPTA